MTLSTHIQTLEQKHQALEDKLLSLTTSPSIPDTEIAEVKRQKLQLKDEICRLKSDDE